PPSRTRKGSATNRARMSLTRSAAKTGSAAPGISASGDSPAYTPMLQRFSSDGSGTPCSGNRAAANIRTANSARSVRREEREAIRLRLTGGCPRVTESGLARLLRGLLQVLGRLRRDFPLLDRLRPVLLGEALDAT